MSIISETVQSRCWHWLDYIHSMPPHHCPGLLSSLDPPGKRNRDQPKWTWEQDVLKDLKVKGRLTIETETLSKLVTVDQMEVPCSRLQDGAARIDLVTEILIKESKQCWGFHKNLLLDGVVSYMKKMYKTTTKQIHNKKQDVKTVQNISSYVLAFCK